MRSSTTLALIIWLCLMLDTIDSFGQQYRFENIGVEEGLSQSQVLSIHQDQNAEIWIGTASGGITRFDGLEYQYLSQKDGIPSNTIYNISSFDNGRIAIASFGGLVLYDSYGLKTYNKNSGLPDDLVYCAFEASDGRIWIGTASGLALLKGNEILPSKLKGLEGKAIFRIQESEDGTLWFSTIGSGLFRCKNGRCKHFNLENGLPGANVNGVYIATDSTLVFTYDGIVVIKGDSLESFPSDHPLSSDLVFDAIKDSYGTTWFATKRGLYFENGGSGYYRESDGIVGELMCTLIEDREGNIWAGSREKGVTRLNRKAFKNLDESKGLPSNSVNRVLSRSDSSVWIASDAGVTVVDRGGEIKDIGKGYGLHRKTVRCFYDDTDKVYLGTKNGVYTYSNTGKLRKIYNPINQSYFIQDLVRYRDTIIAATNEGLAFVRGKGLRTYEIEGLPQVMINQLLIDRNDKLWIGTNEQGLWRVDNGVAGQMNEVDGFTARTVKALYEDKEGLIWCATNSGLFKYEKGRFRLFSSDDGLSSNTVVSIIQVDDSTYWAGLNKGANRFIFKADSIQSVDIYGMQDGFNGQESNPRAICLDATSKIWFGTNGGVNIYDPEKDSFNKHAPVTRIEQIRLFMQETDWKEHSEGMNRNGLPLNVNLPYDQNNISIHFKGVSHINAELIKYKYRLIGEDSDWIYTEERNAEYSNLDHGQYTFEVHARNSDGVWTDKPASWSFEISPPFWKTIWFYGLCLLMVVVGIFSYFKIRSANKKITQINELLTEQKDIISKKNKDIIDSIKYAKRIQDAVLPSPEEIDLPKTFIFNRPKDVVSGDFYWFYNKGDLSLFAVADCTGHGVPGAFMSIIGHNNLNKIVGEKGITEPSEILSRLNNEISSTLNRRVEEEGPIRDGLDIALCCFNRKTEELLFAGAHHSLLIWRMGELKIYKGERKPIGSGDENTKYSTHTVQLLKGDMIYLYTDGFVDQFGGEKGKKYKTVRFRKLLEKLGKHPISEQRNMLIREFETWKGDQEQVDDVLVLGTLL